MTDSHPSVEINIRATRYCIARTRGVCPHCLEQTDLFALALPTGHETLDIDEAAEDAGATDAWIYAGDPAFIFHIEWLNGEVAAQLASLTGSFRIGRQDSTAESAWTNHCETCGSPLDDEALFCEPGEAFFPTGVAGASAIRLLPIEERLEAAAGGYAFDPNFFDAMTAE